MSTVKREVRRAIDRAARPYVDEVVRRLSPGGDGWWTEPPPPMFFQLHATLHEARTLALADMPAGAKTMLSPGASGAWYLEWVAEQYGSLERHIGIDAFTPRPDPLPAGVEWITGDIAGAEGVKEIATGSVDLIFSGQNVEHLWPEQMVAFFIESHRVLADGGWLVIDSPNRDLTAPYRWSMSEHTVEFSSEEVRRLFSLAGFSLQRLKGLWLCREHGELLPLDPAGDAGGAASVLRRIVLAANRPDDSFIWWAEATKRGEPDAAKLREMIGAVFERNWAERLNRLYIHPGSDEGRTSTGRPAAMAPRGLQGIVLSGPQMALPPGKFLFELDVTWRGVTEAGAPIGSVELWGGGQMLEEVVLAADGGGSGTTRVRIGAGLAETAFGVHLVVRTTGAAGLEVPLELTLSPDPWR